MYVAYCFLFKTVRRDKLPYSNGYLNQYYKLFTCLNLFKRCVTLCTSFWTPPTNDN